MENNDFSQNTPGEESSAITQEQRQKMIDKGNVLLDLTLFTDFYSMEDEEIGRLMRDIGKYIGIGVVPQYTKDDRVLSMAFKRFKVAHEANTRKYFSRCEKSKEAIKKRWGEHRERVQSSK